MGAGLSQCSLAVPGTAKARLSRANGRREALRAFATLLEAGQRPEHGSPRPEQRSPPPEQRRPENLSLPISAKQAACLFYKKPQDLKSEQVKTLARLLGYTLFIHKMCLALKSRIPYAAQTS